MLRGIKVRGPFTGPSGYDHHVREFVRTLSSRGMQIQLENLEEWSQVRLPHNLRDPWYESLSSEVEASVALHFSFPNQVSPAPSMANVNFTMFEASGIPQAWVDAHSLSDVVVVPTRHSLEAWVASGVPETKLRLCPLGVRTDLFRPGVRPMELGEVNGRPLDSFGVRFLNVSELGPRKNLKSLFAAWLKATTATDNAVLVMKVGCYTAGSLGELQDQLVAAEHATGRRLEQAAPIHYIHSLLPDADMPRLYAAATHYISLSFGEGWDLAMIEAASSGLRLIAPSHSGYLTYLDEDVATLLPAQEVPIRFNDSGWMNELFEGLSWWQPDDEAAVEAIRQAIAMKDAPRASARQRLVSCFTWESATDRLVAILEEAEGLHR